MSADYDRLFQSSSDDVQDDEHTVHVDRDAILSGAAAPMPTGGAGRDEAAPPPMPVAPPRTQTAPAPPPRQTEITSQIPPTPAAGPQRPANGMMRAPQANAPAGARFEQPRSAPAPPPRPAPAPGPVAALRRRAVRAERHLAAGPAEANQPAPTSAATMGNHRAIDALSHVGVRIRGQDALAARVASCDLPADADQSGPVARRALRDGPARPDSPQCA